VNYCQEFDDTTEVADGDYLDKVYKIATGEENVWINIELAKEAFAIFKMRERQDWQGPDSIFDAWLLYHGKRRTWFPYAEFIELYPEYMEIRPNREIFAFEETEEEEEEEKSKTDEETEEEEEQSKTDEETEEEEEQSETDEETDSGGKKNLDEEIEDEEIEANENEADDKEDGANDVEGNNDQEKEAEKKNNTDQEQQQSKDEAIPDDRFNVYIGDTDQNGPSCSFVSCSTDRSTPGGIILKQELPFKAKWINTCQPIIISDSDEGEREQVASKRKAVTSENKTPEKRFKLKKEVNDIIFIDSD